MGNGPVRSVQWNGRETVTMVSQMIAYSGQIEIRLSPVYNHVLFQKLHPEARGRVVEKVDKSGDPELLKSVSEIDGLEDLALLVDMLHAEDASVQIVSPPGVIITLPGGLPPAA